MKPFILFLCLPLLLITESLCAETAAVKLRVRSSESIQSIPSRVWIEMPSGEPLVPQGQYNYRGWFPITGETAVKLPKGGYKVRLSRGPEWIDAEYAVNVMEEGQEFTFTLYRWLDMNRKGWWSGDMHIHRPLDVIEPIVAAEDINVAPVLTRWNNTDMYRDREAPDRAVYQVTENQYYSVMNSEHERQDGAVLIFNLTEPLDVGSFEAWYPDAISLLQETRRQGGYVEIEKPFWNDYPLWLALGNPHSVGIVCNHFQETKVMNNSAWGRQRDEGYPEEPVGLALFVMDLYYKALNCGFRLTATGGGASGVLDNPVGQNRTYAYLGRNFTYNRWFDALKAGRTFTTNGPMLLAEVDGEKPGAQLAGKDNHSLRIEAYSQRGIRKVEWIADGKIVSTHEFPQPKLEVILEETLPLKNAHWLTARVFEETPPEIVRFAHTSPFYLTKENPATDHPDDVQYFINWLDEHIERLNNPELIPNEAARKARVGNLEKARAVFRGMMK